ncbi:hypothetical protein [Agromyces arachidis]|uniref:hypothetical protein n=1 Tax=Agromyces arachidis TaxID=766966 RepID=UPI004056B11E
MPKRVTRRNYVRAETAHRFSAHLRRAALNEYHHERLPPTGEHSSAVRPNLDVLFSYAVVDVTDGATFSVAASDEYQSDQLIDEQHQTVAVVYPGESVTLTPADLSWGTHVFVLGRTAIVEPIARTHELQNARRIEAASAHSYRPPRYDDRTRLAVGAQLERRAAGVELDRAYGARGRTDAVQHLLGTRVGWGQLPPEHGLYVEGVATSSGCDIWTFDVPPVDPDRHGFFSVARYDERGRIDVEPAAIAGAEMTRNGDRTVSVYFGDDGCVARGNVLRTAPGQVFRYAMRIYGPADGAQARRYVAALRARGLETVLT